METKGLTVLAITVMCILMVQIAAQSTPFMIYGYVSYENGTACNGSAVNITNLNITKEWSANTNAGYNYYQLMLANGTDVNASEVLWFNVTSPDGSPSNVTEHAVTQENITDGGIFNFNITLEAPAPTPTLVEYTISNRTITPPQTTEIDVKFSEEVKWKITIEDGGAVYDWIGTSTNPTKKIWDGTYETNSTIVPDGIYTVNITWTNTMTGLGGQNNTETITVSSVAAPDITHFAPLTPVSNNESESRTFNITIDQTVNVSWYINGTGVQTNESKTEASYTNTSAVAGYWNVTAYVYNENGSDIQTWWWTVNDTTPPEIVYHTPTGTNVPATTNITATFSKAMDSSTLNTATIIVENSTGTVIGLITYDSATRTVTFDPVNNLNYNEAYNVTITTGVQDLVGNNMSSNYTWNFTTGTLPSTVVSIADVSAPPNGTVTVPIMVNDVTNLGGGEINVTFNSSIVHVTNVTEGDMNLFAYNINNASGWVYINAISIYESGQSGDVVFAYINLTAVGNETDASPLNITVVDDELFNITYYDIPYTASNGTFTITDTTPPLVTNPTANPDTIPNNGTVYSQLNVTVTDPGGIGSVTVNLSSIGGASAQSMNKIPATDIWTVTTNATKGYGLQNLTINATDNAGYSNTSVSIQLNITDATKPVPSNIGANTTEAGMPVLFSAYWTDDAGLANYTFAWNDSGIWVNDTVVEMTGTGNWSNVTKTLNTTLKTIGWRIYCNDTSGNLNDTGIQILTITDTTKPVLSNPSANPPTILNDNGRPRPHGTNVSRLNVTVTDTGSGILNVTINLSAIGGSSVQPMERIDGTNNWTVTANASSGINLTSELLVNATDKAGNSNTSVSIPLTVLRRGDVYRDNATDMKDVLYIARYRAHLEPEWSNPPAVLVGDVVGTAGDPTGDGEVDMKDALYIARYKADLEDEP